jgi:hypothetical protein
MANYVGGDKVIVNRIQVTAAANLVDKTFVDIDGAVPANATKCTGGVVQGDTANTEIATVKQGVGSQLEVIATGTVTAGNFVEILTSTFTTKDTTGVTGAGVQNATSTNVVVGRALTGGVVNDTVLVELLHAVNV